MANQLEAAAMHRGNFFAQPIAILFWYISYLCGKGQGKGVLKPMECDDKKLEIKGIKLILIFILGNYLHFTS